LDLTDPEVYPGHKGHRRALKGLVDTLGLTRELDVHAEHLSTHLREATTPTQAAVIEFVLEQVDRSRAKTRRIMGKQLERLRLPDLGRLLDVPVLRNPFQSTSLQEGAWACLKPRSESALGDLASLATQEDSPALHKVRVRIKKLRYAIEALESAFAEPPEPILKTLRELQTVLGEHHDLAALEALLWEMEDKLRLRNRQTLSGGVLELLGSVAEARRAAFDRFVALARNQDPGAFARMVRPALGLARIEGPRT
jgi:CHAD domain-containing protein